jgi:hypothetical protein
MDGDIDIWKRGGGTNIEMPDPSYWNEDYFFVEMGNGVMNTLHNRATSQNQITFKLVSFGDDDSSNSGDGFDCHHNGFSFDVKVEIAQ